MLVIIHGWSDSGHSFKRLGQHLVSNGIANDVHHVRLGNYVSLDDDVTFDDLIYATDRAWKDQKLPTTPRSVDLIAHSTGGLIVRHWMTRFFEPHSNPVNRLLLLAPANFGSPLAHKGRSFVGRIVKGFQSNKPFQTGTHILRGLELASPFTWNLAHIDLFGAQTWYGPGRVLCTVLVGASGYTGISAAANENGTDGTVRLSTANLNTSRVSFDFATSSKTPTVQVDHAKGLTAFARINAENHSTIAFKDSGPKGIDTLNLVHRALRVTDDEFPEFVRELDARSEKERAAATHRFSQPYQNTVVRLVDDHGAFVDDYFFELFAKGKNEKSVDNVLTRLIQEDAFEKNHVYSENSAYRSLLLNINVLKQNFSTPKLPLFVSITAMPDIKKTRTVGYATFGYNEIGSIRLSPEWLDSMFHGDRTLFVDIKIKREQTLDVFSFRAIN